MDETLFGSDEMLARELARAQELQLFSERQTSRVNDPRKCVSCNRDAITEVTVGRWIYCSHCYYGEEEP